MKYYFTKDFSTKDLVNIVREDILSTHITKYSEAFKFRCESLLKEFKLWCFEQDVNLGAPANIFYKQKGVTKRSNAFLEWLLKRAKETVAAGVYIDVLIKRGFIDKEIGVYDLFFHCPACDTYKVYVTGLSVINRAMPYHETYIVNTICPHCSSEHTLKFHKDSIYKSWLDTGVE